MARNNNPETPRRRSSRRPSAYEHMLFSTEAVRPFREMLADFEDRFAPADHYENEFLVQMLFGLWQRQRNTLFDALNWQGALAAAYGPDTPDFEDTSSLVTASLLGDYNFPARSKIFTLLQEHHARAFHRSSRAWQLQHRFWASSRPAENKPNSDSR